MRAVKIYMDIDDLTYLVKKSVPQEYLEGTENCSWAPIKIELGPDLAINITAVATENR